MDNITLKNMLELYDKSKELLKDIAINHYESLSKYVKAKLLVTALYKKDNIFSKSLFNIYNLPVILLACEILDSKRVLKQLNKKTKKTNEIVKLNKLNEGINIFLTTSIANFIKKEWIKKIPINTLEYWIICKYPVNKWVKLNNLIHFCNNDFASKLFYNYIIDNKYYLDYDFNPHNHLHNFIKHKNINIDEAIDIITKYNLSYNFVKNHPALKKYINNDSVTKLFNNINNININESNQICIINI